ncbi:MAG: RNA-binding protein [Candidatus Bathyarchaeota archaeon]|nr:RNA-binding protein [Candidatus Bathyarchaeota archaeon]
MAIAVPASVVSDTPHLREKTSKVGLIGRAAAIFRVNEIVVYADNPKANQSGDLDLIAVLLEYMETPQYLRKRLFKIEPRLQYAGILPPLRTPHHPLKSKASLEEGEYREGLVLSETKEGLLVDIGVEQSALLREKQFAVGARVTLQIVKFGKQIEVQAVSGEVPCYWGYRVTVERRSLKKLLDEGRFDLVVATSAKGTKFSAIAGELAEKWKRANSVLLAFGAPTRGLYEIAAEEGWRLGEAVDFVANTIPCQGTETVRTEEAVLATLSILNVWFGF